MIGKRLKIIITILAFLLSISIANAVTYIKISVRDCLTCTLNFDRVIKNTTNYLVVLDDSYVDDSSGILDKYGLRPVKNKIIWDGKLYKEISQSDMSEVVQFCDGKEKQRQLLKTANNYEEIDCDEIKFSFSAKRENANSSSEVSKDERCKYITPKHLKIKDFKRYVLLENYITDEMFVLDKTNQSLVEIDQDDSLLKRCFDSKFTNIHQAEKKFSEYKIALGKNSQLKPKVTSATIINDSTLSYCLVTYYIDTVIDGGVYFDKILTIINVDTKGEKTLIPVNAKLINSKLGINEYDMFYYNGVLYFTTSSNPQELSRDDLKIIASFQYRNSSYQLATVEPYLLDDYAIENGTFYNYTTPMASYQYVGFTIADFIIDLKHKKQIKIPFEKKIFESNKSLISTKKGNYFLNKMVYNPKLNRITLYYQLNDYKYVSQFTPGSDKFISTTQLFPISYFTNYIKNATLNYDGTKLVFIRTGQNCIEECSFQSASETIKPKH